MLTTGMMVRRRLLIPAKRLSIGATSMKDIRVASGGTESKGITCRTQRSNQVAPCSL